MCVWCVCVCVWPAIEIRSAFIYLWLYFDMGELSLKLYGIFLFKVYFQLIVLGVLWLKVV